MIYATKGRVAYVVINRPEVLNACDFETYDAIASSLVPKKAVKSKKNAAPVETKTKTKKTKLTAGGGGKKKR